MRAHQTKRMRKYINMEAEFEAGGWLDEGPGSGRVSPGLFEDEEEFSNPLNYCGDDSTAAGGEAVNTPDKTHEKTLEEKRNEVGGADPSLYLGPSPSAPMSGIGLNDDKAGMEGLDKARINQIILEASKGSKYYENEVKKEKQRAMALKAADRELEALEATRDLARIIVHVDMDSFYASVEMRDDPCLKDVPMAVGGTAMLPSRFHMLIITNSQSTSNYHARRYGVRAAMPGFIAKKLCPNLVIVPPHFAKYRAASERVREILARYDPHFSPMGLDESYLDLTEFVKLKMQQDSLANSCSSSDSDPTTDRQGELCSEDHDWANAGPVSPLHWRCAEQVVEGMRREIRERTCLTASAGLAPNMMLAKVASDMNKPDGQFTVTATRTGVVDFVQKLPIRKISGIGKVTERMLNALEVTTCGELYQQRAVLRLLFSHTSSSHFLRVCVGLGSTHVHREYDKKSMSTERTFAEISSVSDLQQKCRELCQDLSRDMHRDCIKGRTIALKLKTVHFEVKTHAVTLPRPVSTADQLYSAASNLLTAEIRSCAPSPLRLRLMGVRVSSLQKGEGGESGGGARGGGGGGGGGKQETLDVFIQQPSASSAATTANRTSAEQVGSSLQCPICGNMLDETKDYRSINTHIDKCLNHSAITGITNTQHGMETPEKTKAPTANTPRKARLTGSERGGVKRTVASDRREKTAVATGGLRKRQLPSACDLKQENELAGVKPCPIKQRKTLDYFWK